MELLEADTPNTRRVCWGHTVDTRHNIYETHDTKRVCCAYKNVNEDASFESGDDAILNVLGVSVPISCN